MLNTLELTVCGVAQVVRYFRGWGLSRFCALTFMLEDTLTRGFTYLLWVEGLLLPGCP